MRICRNLLSFAPVCLLISISASFGWAADNSELNPTPSKSKLDIPTQPQTEESLAQSLLGDGTFNESKTLHDVSHDEASSSDRIVDDLVIVPNHDHSTVMNLIKEQGKEQLTVIPDSFMILQKEASLPEKLQITIDPRNFHNPKFLSGYKYLLRALCLMGEGAVDKEGLSSLFIQDLQNKAALLAKVPYLLSIDGGGIRGLLVISVLAKIEALTGKQIYELFDCQVGTSIGGIIACALSCPRKFNTEYVEFVKQGLLKDEPEKPYSAQEILEMFLREGPNIFGTVLHWESTQLLWGGARWDNAALKKMLNIYFGDARFSDLLNNAAAVYTDLNDKNIHVMSRRKGIKKDIKNYKVQDVCLLGASAPTYFNPGEIESKPAADGGVLMNNPVGWGIMEVMQTHKRGANDIHVMSLGTGIVETTDTLAGYTGYSLPGWARYIINANLNGNTNDKLARKMGRALRDLEGIPSPYVRLQPSIPAVHADTDNAAKENMDFLQKKGQQMYDDHEIEIKEFFTKRL